MDRAAIGESIAGLFDAPGGDRLDVVALACTHFPLLRRELLAAAPRAVAWLDSGDAIAARLLSVLSLTSGADGARLRRAGFTGDGPRTWAAFEARGFSTRAAISAGPGFPVTPSLEERHG